MNSPRANHRQDPETAPSDGANAVVELYHDSLIDSWDELRSWIDHDRPLLRRRDELEGRAQDWTGLDRPDDRLLHTGELAEAEHLERSGLVLGGTVLNYIEASRRWQQRRRYLRYLAVALVACLVVGVAGLAHLWREQMSVSAYAEQLGRVRLIENLADLRLDAEPDVGFLLAALAFDESASLRADDRREAYSHLLDAAAYDPRLVRILHGHDAAVTSVAFALQDGTRFATADTNGRVSLWNAPSGTIERSLASAGPAVYELAVSPHGRWLAAAGCLRPAEPVHTCGGLVKVWDLVGGSGATRLETGTDSAMMLAEFDPDGRLLAAASNDQSGVIYQWSTADWQDAGTLGPPADTRVRSIAYHPDGDRLAAGYADTQVRLWRLSGDESGAAQVYRMLLEHTGDVRAVAFGPEGKWLAAGGGNGGVLVWDLDAPGPFSLVPIEPTSVRPVSKLFEHDAAVRDIAFGGQGDPRGNSILLASASVDGTVLVWDIASTRIRRLGPPLEGHRDIVTSLAFDPTDGTHLLTGSKDGKVVEWNLDAPAADGVVLPMEISAVAFDPTEGRAAVGGRDGVIRVYDDGDAASTNETRPIRVLDARLLEPGRECSLVPPAWCTITAISFVPDKERLVAVDREGFASVWNLETGARIRVLQLTSDRKRSEPTGIATDEKGRRLLTYDRQEGMVLFDTSSGVLSKPPLIDFRDHCGVSMGGVVPVNEPIPDPSCRVTAAAFHPDQPVLLTGDNYGRVHSWDAETGTLVSTHDIAARDAVIGGLAFYATDTDERLVIGDWAGRVGTYQVLEGAARLEPTDGSVVIDDEVRSLVVSDDGSRLAVGTKRGTVRLFDTATLEPIGRPLAGHDYKCLARQRRDECRVWSIAFVPGSTTRLMSATPWGRAVSWDLGPERLRETVCARANRRATANEVAGLTGNDLQVVCDGSEMRR